MFLINFNQWKCACVGINNLVKKNQRFEIAFTLKRKAMSSWIPCNRWRDMGELFHSSNERSWEARVTCHFSNSQKIQCVSVCWKSYGICNLGCIRSHPLGTQWPMQMPTATCCDHYERQLTEDLDMSQGVIPKHYNATPHSAHQTWEKLQMFQWQLQDIPLDSSDVAPLDYPFVGPLSDDWEVTGSSVMWKWTWLFINGTECRRPIHTATEFVNLCQGWPNAAMCSGIILKNHNNSADYMSYISCYNNFSLNFMMPGIVLIKHTLCQEVNCQQDNCHIEIYSQDGFRRIYQESRYLWKNVSIGKQTKISLVS